MSPMKGFFGEMKSKKEVKSRQGSLIFFLLLGRQSIYQVKNEKSGLNIFRPVSDEDDGF